jgi:hypothetical protein
MDRLGITACSNSLPCRAVLKTLLRNKNGWLDTLLIRIPEVGVSWWCYQEREHYPRTRVEPMGGMSRCDKHEVYFAVRGGLRGRQRFSGDFTARLDIIRCSDSMAVAIFAKQRNRLKTIPGKHFLA